MAGTGGTLSGIRDSCVVLTPLSVEGSHPTSIVQLSQEPFSFFTNELLLQTETVLGHLFQVLIHFRAESFSCKKLWPCPAIRSFCLFPPLTALLANAGWKLVCFQQIKGDAQVAFRLHRRVGALRGKEGRKRLEVRNGAVRQAAVPVLHAELQVRAGGEAAIAAQDLRQTLFLFLAWL